MAETKTRSSSGRKKTTKRKATTARRKSPATTARAKSSTGKSRGNGTGRVESARKAVEGTAKSAGNSVGDAGRGVGKAASKAKAPLLASGAALAGVAGGIAIGARRSKAVRGPKLKIDSHDLAKAAKEVGQFGLDMGQLASELRRNREQANGAKRRSPVEVVLDGLTHRG